MTESGAGARAAEFPPAPNVGVAIDWLYEGDAVRVTRYRCLSVSPDVGAEHRQPAHVIAFPYQGLFEVYRGRERAVAEPGSMVFFNEGEGYRTGHPCGGGDVGSAMTVRADVLVEALSRHDPGVVERPDAPFRSLSGSSSPRTYLLQRLLFLHVAGAPDALGVEESALALLEEVAAVACHADKRAAARRATPADPHREAVDAARRFLANRLAEPVTLAAVGRAAGVSPFHLCRVFRAVTGTTVSRYRHRLRLRASLERVADARADLSAVALDHGYSSHSHFTAAFRREFGLTPTEFRRAAGRNVRSVAAFRPRARG